MTEIPAKTPSPIGRTDNFFPGMANAAVVATGVCELEACSAAAADTDADWEALESSAGVPVGVGVGEDVVVLEMEAEVDTDESTLVDAGVPETVEIPLTTIAGVPLALADSVTEAEILSLLDGVALADAVGEDVDEVSVSGSSEVDAVGDGEVEEVDAESAVEVSGVDEPLADAEPLPEADPLFCAPAFICIEHFFTSSTAG